MKEGFFCHVCFLQREETSKRERTVVRSTGAGVISEGRESSRPLDDETDGLDRSSDGDLFLQEP